MKYRVSTYTGVISSIDEHSAIARSLRRIEMFCGIPNSLFGSTWPKEIPVKLEYARSDRFEVLKISFGNIDYFNVKDNLYVLECSSIDNGILPSLHLSKVSDVSRGFRPPCIGFVLPGSDATLFIQAKDPSILPGDGCTNQGTGCQEFIFLDSDNGNLAKASYTIDRQLFAVGGAGYANHLRQWRFDGKDVSYVEKDGLSIVGQVNWKLTSLKSEERPWNSLRDFLAPTVTNLQFETSPGTFGSKSLSSVLLLDSTGRALEAPKNLSLEVGSMKNQSALESSVAAMVEGVGLLAAVSILALWIVRKKPRTTNG